MTTLPESEDYLGQVGGSDRDENNPDKSAESEDDEVLPWILDPDDEQDMPAFDHSSGGESNPPTPALSGSSIPPHYSLPNTAEDVPSKPPISSE